MDYRYAGAYSKETMARAVGKDVVISTKNSVEIAKMIKGMSIEKAKARLQLVIELKKAVPYTRFNDDVAHKKAIGGPGRFPQKTAKEILKILESAEINAQFKGLDTTSMVIQHICAHKAARPWKHGRQGRRKAKRTHFEIILAEVQGTKEPKKENKQNKKEDKQKIKESKSIGKVKSEKEAKIAEKKEVKETKLDEKKETKEMENQESKQKSVSPKTQEEKQ